MINTIKNLRQVETDKIPQAKLIFVKFVLLIKEIQFFILVVIKVGIYFIFYCK